MNEKKNVMVFAETMEDGRLSGSALGIAGAGARLAALTGCGLDVLVLGRDNGEAIRGLSAYKIDRIISVEDPFLTPGNIDVYVKELSKISEKFSPSALLFPMTLYGRELAPRTAALMGAPVISDCVACDTTPEGKIKWTRLSFGGYISAGVESDYAGTRFVSIRPGIIEKPEKTDGEPELIREEADLDKADLKSVLMRTIKKAAQGMLAVEDADVIVAGGRGAGGSAGFKLIRELADVLGGAVGASRVAVDKGWIDHSALIGQSGKTVAPALYITCGIAGSIQHITGMRNSGCVVSINTDPRALIFDVSDYGIVGDLFQVLPVLTEEIRHIKAS